jgi:predicted acetyltransferase
MRLIPASLEPPPSLEEFLRELGDGDSGFGGTKYKDAADYIEPYLQGLIDQAAGKLPDPSWVPMTTFWLLDDDGVVVGMSRLRHELSAELLNKGGHIGYYVRPASRGRGYGHGILALTLEEARRLGIDRALLTTHSDNLRSIRTIEGHGGKLEDERFDPESGKPYRRYWIDLTR